MADMDVDSKANASIVPVVIKHQGKTYNIDVDTSEPGSVFKYQVYSLTSVQPENQKILCKATQVKDDTDMGSLRLKAGQVIMVLGQSGGAPTRFEAPKEKTQFIEDMDAKTLAMKGGMSIPVGLGNLGNTCYLNSSLQVMRSIPELQDSLVNQFTPDAGRPTDDLAATVRDVFSAMATNGETVQPAKLLQVLRRSNPRFAEKTRTGFYAQQDAEEAWSFLINALKTSLRIKDESAASSTGEGSSAGSFSVVERFMTGKMERITVCDEEAGRTPGDDKPTLEAFRTLECRINEGVSHLRDGLLAGLKQTVEKTSEALGRTANFTSTDRIAQLPKYLTTHLLRFSWKRGAQLSTKILRKVSFPLELDASEFCTEELRVKLVPVREKVREIRKEIDEMERSKKKRKRRQFEAAAEASGSSTSAQKEGKKTDDKAADKTKEGEAAEEFKTDAQIEEEKKAALDKSKEELYELVKPQLDADKYANHSGLYELRAVLTHQGAHADSGHYTAFVKKGTILNPVSGKLSEEDGNWLWFNDDVVTEVAPDRIEALAGGGPSHSAFLLLYAAVPLPLPENRITEKFSQP